MSASATSFFSVYTSSFCMPFFKLTSIDPQLKHFTWVEVHNIQGGVVAKIKFYMTEENQKHDQNNTTKSLFYIQSHGSRDN